MKYIVLAGDRYYPNGASDIRGFADSKDECILIGELALKNEYHENMSPALVILYPVDYSDNWIHAYEIATGEITEWKYYDDKWNVSE